MNQEDNETNQKPLNLVSQLFANFDIQRGVDSYINNTIFNHKQDILINFDRWKAERPETLPILHFICLQMSTLDRYISLAQRSRTNLLSNCYKY